MQSLAIVIALSIIITTQWRFPSHTRMLLLMVVMRSSRRTRAPDGHNILSSVLNVWSWQLSFLKVRHIVDFRGSLQLLLWSSWRSTPVLTYVYIFQVLVPRSRQATTRLLAVRPVNVPSTYMKTFLGRHGVGQKPLRTQALNQILFSSVLTCAQFLPQSNSINVKILNTII